MSQEELLKKVILTLDQLDIGYMVSGSIASSLHGEPRSTHGIDIVVNLTQSKVHALAAAFPSPDYYLDEQALAEAVARKGMANLIDTKSGDKVERRRICRRSKPKESPSTSGWPSGRSVA